MHKGIYKENYGSVNNRNHYMYNYSYSNNKNIQQSSRNEGKNRRGTIRYGNIFN